LDLRTYTKMYVQVKFTAEQSTKVQRGEY